MKRPALLSVLLFMLLQCFGQVKVHSHNDYTRNGAFRQAYENRVYSIEADVFLKGDSLLVAHTQKELDEGRTLSKLYIQPIISLFKQYGATVSPDKSYTFQLMIDIKGDWRQILPKIIGLVQAYPSYFDRRVNPLAVSVVISGNRPPDAEQAGYPSFILFDGLPGKPYSPAQRAKIAMISDNFKNSSKWNGGGKLAKSERRKLKAIIKDAHLQGKPVRFWGAPDTENAWRQLKRLGADIINTDKVAECAAWSRR